MEGKKQFAMLTPKGLLVSQLLADGWAEEVAFGVADRFFAHDKQELVSILTQFAQAQQKGAYSHCPGCYDPESCPGHIPQTGHCTNCVLDDPLCEEIAAEMQMPELTAAPCGGLEVRA